MKKTALLLILAGMLAGGASAQETVKKYRRSSLYTIMIPSTKLEGDAKKIVTNTFDTLAIPDKYNDINLKPRELDLSDITVTQAEIDAASNAGAKKKSGFGKFMKGMAAAATGSAGTGGKGDDATNIAKLLKYFKEKKVANQLIGKWYNESATPGANGYCFNYDRIGQLGILSASEEEKAMAELDKLGKNKIMDAAADELIPNTFIMVTYYGFLSSDEIIDMILADKAGGVGGADLLAQTLKAVIKGYFVKTTSYLFQLEWNKDIRVNFENKYYATKDTKAFDASDEYTIKYVGKTWDFAPATMQLTTKSDASAKLISRATVRATDGSIAKLQKKYDVFKTLSTVHVDGDKIYAYIGKKEGLDNGDKFEVLEQVINEDGTTTYNKVTTIKVAKDKVWDNRAGAGEKLEGEASTKEDKGIDPNAKYTEFDGSAKKIMDGMFIKQTK